MLNTTNHKGEDMQNSLFIKRIKTYKIAIKDVKAIFTIDPTFKQQEANITEYDSAEAVKDIHFHLENELFFLTGGPLTVNFSNDKKTYSENSLVIIPAFTPHFSTLSRNSFRLLFKFEKNEHEPDSLFNALYSTFNTTNILELNLNKYIRDILFYLNETLSEDDYIQEEKVISCLTLLFSEIMALLKIRGKKVDTADNDNKYVSSIDYIIHNEFNKKIDLQYIASRLYLSTKQVSRIIKKNFKSSLSELILQKKLSVARLLLIETDLSIAQIILSVNFTTPNYFYTVFKQHYGITPLQYRKQNKFRSN